MLSDEEMTQLAKLGKIVEEHYGKPQDIEWAIRTARPYLLQSRPITTIQNAAGRGGKASRARSWPGAWGRSRAATGKVMIIADAKGIGLVKEGDILVTKMTTPDMVPAMRKVGDRHRRGRADLPRGHRVPRAGHAGRRRVRGGDEGPADEQVVTVDGEMGIVYLGAIAGAAAEGDARSRARRPRPRRSPRPK